jgi:hypothetical protein
MEIPDYDMKFVEVCYWCDYYESGSYDDPPNCLKYNHYIDDCGWCPSWRKYEL